MILHDAGNGPLHREWDEDFSREGLIGGNRVTGSSGLELPNAIEAEPVGANHLRPGVFRQRIMRIHLAGP